MLFSISTTVPRRNYVLVHANEYLTVPTRMVKDIVLLITDTSVIEVRPHLPFRNRRHFHCTLNVLRLPQRVTRVTLALYTTAMATIYHIHHTMA